MGHIIISTQTNIPRNIKWGRQTGRQCHADAAARRTEMVRDPWLAYVAKRLTNGPADRRSRRDQTKECRSQVSGISQNHTELYKIDQLRVIFYFSVPN